MIVKKVALSLLVAAASGAYVWSQPVVAPPDDLLDMAAAGSKTVTGSTEPPVPSAPRAAPTLDATSGGHPSPGLDGADALLPAPLRLAGRPVALEAVPPITAAATGGLKTSEASPDRALVSDPVPLPRQRPNHRAADIADPARHPSSERGLVTRVAMTTTAQAARFGYADGNYTGPASDAYYGLVQIQAVIDGGRLAAIKVLQYPSDRRTSVLINRQALPMLRDEVVAAQSAKVNIISGATLTSRAFIQSLDGALSQARLS